MKIELFYKIEQLDKNNNVVKKLPFKLAESFVQNFQQFLLGHFIHTNTNAKNINNQVVEIAPAKIRQPSGPRAYVHVILSINAGINDSSFGLIVGSGITPIELTDHKLENQIIQGTGIGQLVHGAVSIPEIITEFPNIDLLLMRVFTNDSTANITIKNCGIYMRCMNNTFLLAADVLPTPLDIPHGRNALLTYRIRTVM